MDIDLWVQPLVQHANWRDARGKQVVHLLFRKRATLVCASPNCIEEVVRVEVRVDQDRPKLLAPLQVKQTAAP